MWPGSDSLAGVMQQQRQIKDKRIGQLLEKFPIFKQFGIFRVSQCVELVNADQRVFVRGVAVKKFMLHQTSKLAELGNVLTEEIEPMHQPQSPPNFSFARYFFFNNLATPVIYTLSLHDALPI